MHPGYQQEHAPAALMLLRKQLAKTGHYIIDNLTASHVQFMLQYYLIMSKFSFSGTPSPGDPPAPSIYTSLM